MTKRITTLILILTMLMGIFAMQITVYADTTPNLDLSELSETNVSTSKTEETYSYTWTVEEINGGTVRTLEITLDGADIHTLTLPCLSYGKIHVVINTKGDSNIVQIQESHVFNYSQQWNTITFEGEGNLEIGSLNIQGGGNDHMITVSRDASVSVTGVDASLSFGSSGSNSSTLNVYGKLSVNGSVNCGNVKIGEEGYLYCKRVKVSGYGASDTNEYADAFVMEDGGRLEAIGDTDWSDNETGETYGAVVVSAQVESTDADTVIVLPQGYLPEGYSIKKTGNYITVDNADGNEPKGTSMEFGVIYAATSLKLGFEPEKYIIKFVNEDGTELQSEEIEYGLIPVYKGETPEKQASAEFTYTFAGWTPDVEKVTGEATYTASYTQTPVPVTQHTVTFNSNGGSDVSVLSAGDGEKLIKPTNPTRSDYTFIGWYKDELLTEEYDFESEVTSSFTLYAKWQKKQRSGGGGGVTRYTVKFETNGGTKIKDARVIRNSKLTKPADPQKDEYIFDGWYTEEAFETLYDFDVKVTKSFTIYAKWRKSNVSDILNTEEHFAYVKGYDDNTVRPKNNITRAETTEIFFRLLNEETKNGSLAHENDFDDTDKSAWYNTSVSTMAKLGIIMGKTEAVFDPHAFITRAEFAAVCARFDQNDFEIIDTFSDINGHWAEDEIYEAAARGWIKGYEDGTFRPNEFITRAEVITMINRMTGRTPESADDLHENMKRWADNSDEKAWYYIAIQEATNDHGYTLTDDGSEKWQSVSK